MPPAPPTREASRAAIELILESFQGQLPHPALAGEYEKLCPGATDRMLAMAERQSKHRQDSELAEMHGEHVRALAGIVAGSVVALAVVVAGVLTTVLAHNVVAGSLLVGGPVAALAAVFVYGTRSRRKERIEKTQVMAERLTRGRGRFQQDLGSGSENGGNGDEEVEVPRSN